MSPEDAKEAGAIVVDGGVTYHPGIDSHFDFGMYDSHDLFGCLVEATLLAMMNGKCPPVIDRPSPETIRLLANAAEQVEIEWRTRSFDQPLPADDITRAKAARAATT